MNFNHDIGNIDTILSIDTTIAPPLGGLTQTLQIIGTGSVILPVGLTTDRPTTPASGMFRYNTTLGQPEYYGASSWNVAGSGSVTSVNILGGTGITSTGGPITSSGSIQLTLNAELQGLSALVVNGIVARTSTGTYATRILTGTAGNITIVNGDGIAGNPTIDLASVGTAVTGSFVKITTDAKGRVSATTPVVSLDITSLVDPTYVKRAGDTMISGANLAFVGGGEVIGLPAIPSNSTSAASKAYVDSITQGLNPKHSARVSTTTNGALATAFAAGQVVDGVTLAAGDRILIKNQTTQSDNGIYTVSATGAPTRSYDSATYASLVSAYLFVELGTVYADSAWVSINDQGGTLGTTPIVFVQFSGAGTYSAGTGLTLNGTTFSISSPISPLLGGTGTITAPTAGKILIGGATGLYSPALLTPGTGISIISSAGSITIANTGILSVAGTANQITSSTTAGVATLSLPSAVTIGTLTLTGNISNSFAFSGTGGLLTTTAAPTNGQLLIGSTGAAPVAAALTAGSGISVTNAAGSITLANTGVTSIVAGTGITVSGAAGAVTVTNAGVTSVALSITGPLFTVTGSPVTSTGTLTATLNAAAQNTFFAGAITGSSAPTFRAIAFTDLSSAIQLYRENPSAAVASVATGANSVALGSGSSSTAAGATAIGSGSAARTYGMIASGSGAFATAGDAQNGIYVARNVTTTATLTELFLDGTAGTQRIIVPTNGLMTFSIIVAARRTDAVGGGAGYRVDGVIRKDTTAASTTIIGTPSKSVLGETNSIWDVVVDADTTNGSLRIRCSAEAAKTVRWVATVITSEVTN